MNRRMNVCMVVHAYYLKDARVRRYAELLAGLGHEVDVLCLNEGDEPEWEKHNGVYVYRVNVARRRGDALRYMLEYSQSFVKFAYKLITLKRTGKKYDIFHIHNFPNFLVFTCMLQKYLGAKIILDMHDPMPELFMSKFCVDNNHPLIRVLLSEERLSLKFADFVIVVNDFVQEFIVKRGFPKSKTAVIMNSPDKKFYFGGNDYHDRPIQKDRFEILYVGTISKRYGLETLIEAIGKIIRSGRIPNLRLTFMPKLKDEGDYARALLKRINGLGLNGQFRILEPAAHDLMPDVLRRADLSVYTPNPDIHMDIALSLKIPEVIAIGRPIVASRLSVLEKYFGEECLFMFAPGNAEECAARIIEVYDRPEEVGVRVKKAQSALEKFSWEKQSQIYLGIINSLWN